MGAEETRKGEAMSRAEWELVEMARARALADRYEREALESAVAHGCVGVGAQQAWALGWLAMRCADRQVRLEAAARSDAA